MPTIVTMGPNTSAKNLPKVDKEFEHLLPYQSDEDAVTLERLLVEDGEAREPIEVWGAHNLILDGMTRFRICRKHGLQFKVQYREFPGDSREEAIKWIWDNQLCRRNLNEKQRLYAIGKRHEFEKQSTPPASRTTKEGHVVHRTAKMMKVSERTVRRAASFARAVDATDAAEPGTRAKILTGEGRVVTKVMKRAPILCRYCLRHRPVKNCPKCAEAQRAADKRRKPKPKPDNLFPEPKAPKVELAKDAFEKLAGLITQVATLATTIINDHGERAHRLLNYLTWNGLIDYVPGKPAKFLPLVGVHGLVAAAGKKKGLALTEQQAKEQYQQACGLAPWIPPATASRRARKEEVK